MPRTTLTVTSPKGPHPGTVAAGALAVTFQAGDPANGNTAPMTGREVLVIQNSDPTNPATVTIKSTADPYGRTGDIAAYSVPANSFAAFKLSDQQGWRQPDGGLHLDIAGAGAAAVKFLVLRV